MSDNSLPTDQAHRFVAFNMATADYLGHGATDVDALRASLRHTGGCIKLVEVLDCADKGVHIVKARLPLHRSRCQPNVRPAFRGDGFAPAIPTLRLAEMTQALGREL